MDEWRLHLVVIGYYVCNIWRDGCAEFSLVFLTLQGLECPLIEAPASVTFEWLYSLVWQSRVVASRYLKNSNYYVLFDENEGMELGNACSKTK